MLVTNNYSGSQLSFLGLEGICLEGFLMEISHVLLAFDIIIFCFPRSIWNFLFDQLKKFSHLKCHFWLYNSHYSMYVGLYLSI